jgi:Ca-activated chloride channel family protein
MAREEVGRFIRARSQDRIGLVTFGEQALTRVPPTADHDHLLDVLDGLEVGSRDEGTALGIGLGLAAHGTLNVPSPTRIVLVLTDGRSNRGQVEPLSAAEAARALGVRIHAVGVGHQGGDDPLDEALLKRIVGIGGGRFFRAEDARGLRDVLSELNTLETGPVAHRAGFVYESRHVGILVLALLLLAAEAGLGLRSRGGAS